MSWTTIFTTTYVGLAVTVCKAYLEHKAAYTVRLEVEKKDEKGTYLSPNIPASTTIELAHTVEVMEVLLAKAACAIQDDKNKDTQAEEARVKALSAKPGAQLIVKDKVKGAPRANGKTARKKAKLEAARKQMSA